jgi:hypothetical protein
VMREGLTGVFPVDMGISHRKLVLRLRRPSKVGISFIADDPSNKC